MKKLFCGVLFACECFANEAILNEVGQEIVNCATHRVVEKSKKVRTMERHIFHYWSFIIITRLHY